MWKRIVFLASFIFFGVFQANAQQVDTLWHEDFEGDWESLWHADAGTWNAGNPTSGPETSFKGQKCAATVLDGSYAEPVDSRLIRHVSFKVPSRDSNPRLRFWHWYSFSTYDYGEVQIKTENGEWEQLYSNYTNTSSYVWTYPSIDLSEYADSTVQIAFYFHSHRCYNYGCSGSVSSGWYIDEVSLIIGPYEFQDSQESFEFGIGDWSVDRGTWQVGKPSSGPDSTFSDTLCAATVLDGNYGEPVDSRLVSPPVLLPSAEKAPSLRFRHWYSFSTYDYGIVQIRTANSDWITISNQYTNTGSDEWTYPYFSLAEYADSTVQIGFYFHSHGNVPIIV